MTSHRRHTCRADSGLVLVRWVVGWTHLICIIGLLVGTEATYPCTSQVDRGQGTCKLDREGRCRCLLQSTTRCPAGAATAFATHGASACECTETGNELILSCDRIRLQKLPTLSYRVTRLDLFRLDLSVTSLDSEALTAAPTLTSVRIDSCDLTLIEDLSFAGLYSLQVLNLADNRLSELPPRLFADSNLLQELDLSYNSLTHLQSDTFYGLRNLITLDLSYNRLQSLPVDLLLYLPSLKTLRLQDSLQNINVLPLGMFDYTPQLQTLQLQDNQLSDIQLSLFNGTGSLAMVDLSSNRLSSISHHSFDGLSRLESLLLDGNPLTCDCKMRGYRDWLQEPWRRNWSPETTGTCSEPAHLRSQHVTNLPSAQFYCSPPPSTKVTSSWSETANISNDMTTKSQHSAALATSTLLTQTGPDFNNHSPEAQKSAERKQQERGIIIGSSIAAAIFLIAGNILVIVCIKRSRQRRATKKIKYILRPEDVNPGNDEPVDADEKGTRKNVRVEEAGYGYTISNGFSGVYHTGSGSRLHPDDTPPRPGEQRSDMENNEAARKYDDKLYRENSIPRSLSSYRHYNSMSQAVSNQGLTALDCTTEQLVTVDRLNYTYPILSDELPERDKGFHPYYDEPEFLAHQQQQELWQHPQPDMTGFTEEPVFANYISYDGAPHDGMSRINPGYIDNSDYLIMDSVGSADSGVDSNSPIPIHHILLIQDTSTPNKRSGYATLPTRPARAQRLPSADDTQYSSQSLKKVRSETYV